MSNLNQQNNYNSGSQSNTSSNTNQNTSGKGSISGGSATFIGEKDSPTRLAEDMGSGRKTGCSIYIQNRHDGQIVAKTDKFYMQQFAIGLKERSQILETFGTANVSFFGSSTKLYNFGGSAVDWGSASKTQPYEYYHTSSLMQLYESMLKGSELVKSNRIAVIKLLNHTVFGYPLALNVQYDQGMDKMATFSMGFLVTKHLLTLPGVFSSTQLQLLYDPTARAPKNAAAEAMLMAINAVTSACLMVLNIPEGSKFDDGGSSNMQSLSIQDIQYMETEEAGSLSSNWEELGKVLISYMKDDTTGAISPFIATNFATTEEGVEKFISETLIVLEFLGGEDLDFDNYTVYKSRLDKIANFADLLQTLKQSVHM